MKHPFSPGGSGGKPNRVTPAAADEGDPERQQDARQGEQGLLEASPSGMPTVITHVLSSFSGKRFSSLSQKSPRLPALRSPRGKSSDDLLPSAEPAVRAHGHGPPAGGAGLGVPHGAEPSAVPPPALGHSVSSNDTWSQSENQHWMEHATFRAVEMDRREINKGSITDGRLFMSHCWRQAEIQSRKRRMVAQLSLPAQEGGPGLAYWADWLDLQSGGPVPWGKEIEEGIERCSKMVCFVDAAYLKSYNCLKEVAYGIKCQKPLVVVILDQEAWELLTVPGGAHRAWSCNTWGTPLSSHDGDQLPGYDKFCETTVATLFSTLSAINLCPCRPLEESNWGQKQLLSNMTEYVCKDIAYMKEHATLKAMATLWDSKKRPASLLLHQKEAYSWYEWVKFATSSEMSPAPSDLQTSFVQQSVAAFKRRRNRALALAGFLVVLIIAGAVASVILAVKATRAEAEAETRATVAAMWTGVGRFSDMSGTASEMRLLLLLLSNLVKLGPQSAGEILSSEIMHIFYRFMGLNVINSGTVSDLEKSWGVAWSPDNSQMAYAAEIPGNPVFVQNIHMAQPAIRLGNHSAPVHGLAWHSAGSLAAADQSGMVTIYNVATMQVSQTLDGAVSGWEQAIEYTPVAFSPSGNHLVTSSGASSAVRLWDLSTGNFSTLTLPQHNIAGPVPSVTSLAFSSAGALVVSRTDGLVAFLEALEGAESGAEWQTVNAAVLADGAHSAVFFPDGKFLATGGVTSPLVSLHVIPAAVQEVQGTPATCNLSCDVTTSVESSWTNKEWGADAVQTSLHEVLGWTRWSWLYCNHCKRNGWPADCVAFGPENLCPASKFKPWGDLTDNEQMAAGIIGYSELLWDAAYLGSCCSGIGAQSEPLLELESSSIVSLGSLGQQAPISLLTALAVSPEMKWLAASSMDGLLVWDLTGSSSAGGLPSIFPSGWTNALAWSAGGRYLAATNAVGEASIWDFKPQSPHRTLQLATQRLQGMTVAFSNAGDVVASGGTTGDRVELHDPSAGLLLDTITPPDAEMITQIAFSHDDSYIAMSAEKEVEGTGHLLLYHRQTKAFTTFSTPNQTWANGVAFHPQDNKVAVTVGSYFHMEGRMIQVWDLDAPPEDGPARIWTVPEMPGRVGFSPGEGRFLASTTGVANTEDKSAYVWDLKVDKEVDFGGVEAVAEIFGNGALDLQWSPAFDHPTTFALATSCQDRTVRVVYGDFAEPKSITSTKLLFHEDVVYSVRWSPDGGQLVSAGNDGRVYVWSTTNVMSPVLTHRMSVRREEAALSAVALSPTQPHLAVLEATGELHRVVLTDPEDMVAVIESLFLEFSGFELAESDHVALGLPAKALEILTL